MTIAQETCTYLNSIDCSSRFVHTAVWNGENMELYVTSQAVEHPYSKEILNGLVFSLALPNTTYQRLFPLHTYKQRAQEAAWERSGKTCLTETTRRNSNLRWRGRDVERHIWTTMKFKLHFNLRLFFFTTSSFAFSDRK